MQPQFPDYPISPHLYAEHRPQYPGELFRELAQSCQGTDLAWEAGCGTGQATKYLSSHFSRIVATDASSDQISKATSLKQVSYLTSSASVSPLANDSADLVFTAQAIHWFDRQAFVNEAIRVLRPQGTFAYLYYSTMQEDSAITATTNRELSNIFNNHGPAEWRNAYETPDFSLPFQAFEFRQYLMEANWNFIQLSNYLHTRIDIKACEEATGSDPVVPLMQKLAEHWPDPEVTVTFRWPVTLCIAERPLK